METNIQSSSFKMNTPIPSHLKTSIIRQCILQQYEPKSTTDSDATFQKPMNGSFELDDSYHTNMSSPDIPLINEFMIKSTLPRPRWNTTSLGNGNPQRETHNPNIHIKLNMHQTQMNRNTQSTETMYRRRLQPQLHRIKAVTKQHMLPWLYHNDRRLRQWRNTAKTQLKERYK